MKTTGPGEIACEVRLAVVDLVPHLRAYARSLTGNADRADDLVQDAVVRALGAAHQYRPGTNIKAWMFTILRNCYFSDFRARRKEKHTPIDAHPDQPAVAPSQEGVLSFGDFSRAFWQLSPEHREVLLLIGASGISYDEAAAICGCAVGTIKSRTSRAREELQRILSEGALALTRRQSKPIAGRNALRLLEEQRSPRTRKAPAGSVKP